MRVSRDLKQAARVKLDDAVGAVVRSLNEFLALERRTAKNSHSQIDRGARVWNGKIWREGDADSYAMCARAQLALNALATALANADTAERQPSPREVSNDSI